MDLLKFWVISICVASAFWSSVHGIKECTNVPTEFYSHTVQYELSTSKNQTLKNQFLSHYDHLIPTDDSQWSKLFPRKALEKAKADEFNWMKLYRQIKNAGSSGNRSGEMGNFLKEVSLHDVRLDPYSIHGQAQQTNLEYLLMLDVDNLVWSFRKTAGLQTSGTPYGGWEAPDVQLRGHFVGHYMSASARMWASTHNDALNEKMSKLVCILDECQKAIGTGYLSAFPDEEFDLLEAIKYVWAPYYTIHKIMAGLLDQYSFAGNARALEMATWMADYFGKRVQNVISRYSLERHWLTLNTECGGMNDVLYRLYSKTGDYKHLVLAHLFDKPCFLGLLAVQADSLSGFHTNTHIPVVIGSQRRYEVTGDSLYKTIGTYFMGMVNSSHCYATGGTSSHEHWTNPSRLADTLGAENEESCTTYNMLKVSRHLFRWTKETAYADYYERALTNGVLSIQRGKEPGVMIYMLPLGQGVSKAHTYHGWGTKFDSFWCCYGTAIESFSKLGDSIYFEEEGNIPGLYIIQYISSSFNWRNGQIMINQTVEPVVSSDPRLRLSLSISTNKETNGPSTLHLRIPIWAGSNGAKATLNGKDLALPSPGNYLSVTEKWNSNDKLTLELPLSLRTEAIKDDRQEYASIQAILFGPYLLAGLTDGDWNIKTGTAKSMLDWIKPIPPTYNSQLFSLTQEITNLTLALTYLNNSVTMQKLPEPGTISSVHATFRLAPEDANFSQVSSSKDLMGKSVTLEPFNLPRGAVVNEGHNKNLMVACEGVSNSSLNYFQVVAGLNKKPYTFSLESKSQRGCFVYGGVKEGDEVKLMCKPRNAKVDDDFADAASFGFTRGVSEYHPISFAARGVKQNFLLMPLISYRDETYTVYFNIGT